MVLTSDPQPTAIERWQQEIARKGTRWGLQGSGSDLDAFRAGSRIGQEREAEQIMQTVKNERARLNRYARALERHGEYPTAQGARQTAIKELGEPISNRDQLLNRYLELVKSRRVQNA